MKALIIEDEINAFELLRNRIQKIVPGVEVLGPLQSIVAGINWFKNNNEPDLVFLDVELEDGQSFEIFKHVELNCPIIFTTAYDQYAIRAFTLNSVDYLMKPISESDLEQALDKIKKMKQVYAQSSSSLLGSILKEKEATKSRSRFLVSVGSKYFFLKTNEVAFFYSEEGLTFLKTFKNQRYILDESLDQLVLELDPSQFFRINRSHIINLDAIEATHDYLGNRFKLEIIKPIENDGLIVSRARRREFKNWLGGK